MNKFFVATAALVAVTSQQAVAASVKIDDLIVAKTIPAEQRDAEVRAAEAFYEFWNTGDDKLLPQALSPKFVDHTLTPGRPQGPQGPAYASAHFRAAVPDLGVEVQKMVVADEYVTVHMEFYGHFTGSFGKIKGEGQKIAFIATDLLKISDGKITDNWHIEDNLTLLSQMGTIENKD